MGEWIKKLWYSHTMEYYIATKQKEILPLLTAWMDFEDITLSEKKSQTANDKTV